MDEFAATCRQIRKISPMMESEIGDTGYGIATKVFKGIPIKSMYPKRKMDYRRSLTLCNTTLPQFHDLLLIWQLYLGNGLKNSFWTSPIGACSQRGKRTAEVMNCFSLSHFLYFRHLLPEWEHIKRRQKEEPDPPVSFESSHQEQKKALRDPLWMRFRPGGCQAPIFTAPSQDSFRHMNV